MSNGGPPSPGPRKAWQNWISLSGLVLVGSSVFAFLFLFAMDMVGKQTSPYMGILAYVVAPGFHVLGWMLFGIGIWIHRRHERRGTGVQLPHAITVDLTRPRDRKMLIGFVGGTVAFLLITAMGSYHTYHYSESVQFCGQACHEPMKPEFVTYHHSPHARVECVECHVGSGADHYVKAKLNGVHQLLATIGNSYHRPIETPVKNLRPAQDTCEQCHWPNRYVGNLDKTYTHFLADETNTPFSVRLSLKVGGGDPSQGPAGGIHWHMNLGNKVEYIATDPQRQDIPWVRLTKSDGKVVEFKKPDWKGDPGQHKVRTMDCMDCHNRPAHRFQTPNDAVDLAMATGRIDPAMPWVKSNTVAVLISQYSTEDEALQKIAATLSQKYPGNPKTPGLVAVTQEIFKRNFFPEMKADWRAYPENISHKDWAGCFRCHDGSHKASDGKTTISASSCNSCHTILAQGAGADLEKLNPKGHEFFHIDAEYSDFSCNNCHTGAFVK